MIKIFKKLFNPVGIVTLLLLLAGIVYAINLKIMNDGNKTEKQAIKGTEEYTAINNLIVSERMYRASHRNEELAKCYADDAQIRTSWQSGGVNTFLGKSPNEVVEELPLINRSGSPLISQNGDKSFVEYPTTTTRGVYINKVEAVLTSYMAYFIE